MTGPERMGTADALAALVRLAEVGRPRGVHLMFSHEARFNDPLVTSDRRRLEGAEFTTDQMEVAERVVSEERGPSIFFPAPMARALGSGVPWELAADRFHYDMIVVDEDGRWTWRGGPVADRTRDFFLEHLGWLPEIRRWFFEYKIHDGWWDRSYLDARVSPLLGVRLEEGADGPFVVLRSGGRPAVPHPVLRLDDRERLFVDSELGEVMLSDAERFRLLSGASEAMDSVQVGGRVWTLQWPGGKSPSGPDGPAAG